jgi:hypothetical protein
MASIKEKTERVWHIAVANLSIGGGMVEREMDID